MRVLDAYPTVAEAFCGVREVNDGAYCEADCPLVNHTAARMRFWIGTDGRLMFGCWHGCSKLDILRAVGWKWKDTFPDGAEIERHHQRVADRYPYCDEAGRLLYETVRLEPGRGGRDKDFYQRRPDPSNASGWINSLGDVRRVLYRLPELLAADARLPVFVVAGEKDANSLAALGLLATTNVCGERAEWLESYTATLFGREVTVIEDADEVGRRHANEKVGSLLQSVRSLRRCRLPAKDSTEFLNGLRRSGVTDRAALGIRFLSATSEAKQWRSC